MAATITVTNAKVGQTATITIAGAAATTAHVLRIVHPEGATETHSFTTTGAGGATITYYPQVGGTATHNLDLAPVATGGIATATVQHSH